MLKSFYIFFLLATYVKTEPRRRSESRFGKGNDREARGIFLVYSINY